jgi:predicted acylesterase/phospholipase RssA
MSNRVRRILYYAPAGPRRETLLDDLRTASSAQVAAAHDPDAALHILEHLYVHLLIIDLRDEPVAGLALLDRLDDTDDIEARYGFHRVIALVGGPDPEAVDQLIVDLGARGVRTVLRQRPSESRDVFARRIECTSMELISHRHLGKRALCAAGGGVTGIYFELGALKCLDDCLSPGAVTEFDMYFGISAGAVVTSLLANGFSPDEIMAAVVGAPGGRIGPVDFRIARLGHLDYRDLARHMSRGLRSAVRQLWAIARRREGANFNSLLLELADSIGPPFHSDGFEKMLREILVQPGATNDFRGLRRPLYVGATDQDARSHLLFGTEKHTSTPISRAVQASLSINPAFTSVSIGERFYEDGAVTRTSNFVEAIRRDATLVFTVDPFVPYVSKQPGAAQRRGLLYNADQNIRAISYTRFENARSWVLRKHPDVSSYTFLPSNTLRRVLSLSPMDHRPYLEIWRGAYLSTLQRVNRLAHRMRGDLAAHGFELDTTRAEAVAEQLRASSSATFADFFPDRRIDIVRPPLGRERRRRDVQSEPLIAATV